MSRSSATGWPAGFGSRTCTSTSRPRRAAARRTGSGRPFPSGSAADARVVRRHPVLGRLRLSRPATGQALAARLASLLRPSGVLYGFFGTTAIDLTHYTRFVVEDQDTFRHRAYPATLVRRNVLVTRDITRMFDPLAVTESVLLKTSSRETLFRKPRRASKSFAGRGATRRTALMRGSWWRCWCARAWASASVAGSAGADGDADEAARHQQPRPERRWSAEQTAAGRIRCAAG